MTAIHPVQLVVRVWRNDAVIHLQHAASHAEAAALKARFAQVPHSRAEIVELHDGEADITAMARDIVGKIAAQEQD